MGAYTQSTSAEAKTYESLAQASASEGIPRHILSTAKNAMGAPGFRGSRIDWHILKPWLDEHRQELEDLSGQSVDEIKRQNLLKDGILKDLEIAKRKREYIDPAEIKTFLQGFGSILSAELKKKKASLRSKCAGYEGVIDAAFVDIFDAVRKELEKWNSQ